MVLVWPEVPPQFSGGEISSMSRVFFAQLNARNYEREILGLELAFYIFSFVNTFLVNMYDNKKLNQYH